MKRSLTVSVLALLFGSYATVVPTTATAGQAAAAPPRGSLSVQSALVDVTTSEGEQLELLVEASHGELDVDLAKGLDSDTYFEEHDFTFLVSPGLRFDRSTGRGSIEASGSDLHHYGRVQLKVRQTRDWTPAQDCKSGTFYQTRVHIRGTLFFRTRASGDQPWGNVGTATKPLEIDTHGDIFADNNCEPAGPTTDDSACDESVFWSDRKLFGASFAFDSVRRGLLGALDFHLLPHTNGDGFRLDNFFVQVAPPVFTDTGTGARVDVAGSSDGRVTGTATLTADGAGTSDSAPCDAGTGPGSGTETVTDWDNATFTNGVDPLTLHPDLGAPMVAHEGTDASIEHITPDSAPAV